MSSAQDLSWDDAATLLDLQGALLCMRSQEGLLNPENEECVVFYLLPGQGPASFSILLLQSFCYYGDFVHRGETVQPGAQLFPASSLLVIFFVHWLINIRFNVFVVQLLSRI